MYAQPKFGPRPRSVARSLGLRSREKLARDLFPQRQRLPIQCKPHDLIIRFSRSAAVLRCPSSSFAHCDSLGTTTVPHHALPFVAATDRASESLRMCAMLPVFLITGHRNEQIPVVSKERYYCCTYVRKDGTAPQERENDDEKLKKNPRPP